MGAHPNSELRSISVTTTKIGRGIPKVVSLFSDVRTVLEDADRHEIRTHGLADDVDIADFVDLEEEAIDDIKKR